MLFLHGTAIGALIGGIFCLLIDVSAIPWLVYSLIVGTWTSIVIYLELKENKNV